MTSAAEVAAARATIIDVPPPATAARVRRRRSLGRALVLLVAYLVLGATLDPRGSLGTDTGGKLATLATMDAADRWVPDVGYWAEGSDALDAAHPLYYTQPFANGHVNVTTLPMLLAAHALDEVGGTRLALALPMLGGVATAAAARALARRLGARRPTAAFWLVGLASPTLLYSLDLWEHTLGLAAMAWGVVAWVDAASGRPRPGVAALLGGLALGAAATMRTEALVFAALGLAMLAVGALRARRRVGPVLVAAVGVAVPLALNHLLERAVLGGSLRAERATDTVSAGGADLGRRLDEATRTLLGTNLARGDLLVGAALSGLLVLAALAAVRGRENVARGALAGAAALLGVRMTAGLGFVSGLVPALPIAAFAVGARAGRARALALLAVASLPVVWALQYVGGAGPQWGARYLLLPGLVLGVVGLTVVETGPTAVRRGVVALCVAITAFGFVGQVERTHAVADAIDRLDALDADVVVSGEAHLLREAGAGYDPTARRMTAVGPEALAVARSVLAVQAPERYVVIGGAAADELALPGYRGIASTFDFLGEAVPMVTYVRSGA